MKDVSGVIRNGEKEYRIVFNLNVMERIQEEYKTLDAWGKLTEGASGEPDIKAIVFGFTEMINEAIDIENDENGTDLKPLTRKQVGRLISDFGVDKAVVELNNTVIKSAGNNEKNA